MTDDDDTRAWTILILAALAAFGGGTFVWRGGLRLLAEHHVLTTKNPIVTLPGSGGLGLDAPRLQVLAGVALAALALLIWTHRTHARSGEGRR